MSKINIEIIKNSEISNTESSIKAQLINVFIQSNQSTGFPLHKPTDWIDECDMAIILQDETTQEIIGYTLINHYTTKSLLTKNDVLYNPDNIINEGVYIEQVAILPEYQNKQFGIMMYNKLYEIIPENINVYAHVAVNNKQSLKFHCKQGFIPIGDYYCDDFYGYKNYHSILLEKIKKY